MTLTAGDLALAVAATMVDFMSRPFSDGEKAVMFSLIEDAECGVSEPRAQSAEDAGDVSVSERVI